MEKYPFRLPDLKLKRPPVNPNTAGRTDPQTHKITYKRSKGKTERTDTARIVIVHVNPFGFQFCFRGSTEMTNSLVAQVSYDNVDNKKPYWSPPHWHIHPSRGNEYDYEIRAVSWDPDYQKRFTKKGNVRLKEELYRKKHRQLIAKL